MRQGTSIQYNSYNQQIRLEICCESEFTYCRNISLSLCLSLSLSLSLQGLFGPYAVNPLTSVDASYLSVNVQVSATVTGTSLCPVMVIKMPRPEAGAFLTGTTPSRLQLSFFPAFPIITPNHFPHFWWCLYLQYSRVVSASISMELPAQIMRVSGPLGIC
jgi:hypothetical protein